MPKSVIKFNLNFVSIFEWKNVFSIIVYIIYKCFAHLRSHSSEVMTIFMNYLYFNSVKITFYLRHKNVRIKTTEYSWLQKSIEWKTKITSHLIVVPIRALNLSQNCVHFISKWWSRCVSLHINCGELTE